MREKVKDLALKESDLSPRELAVQFTDTEKYFVSEASVYRILKSYDLITSPAYVVLSAADEFKDKTTRPNQLWQTDFTYLKVIGWGWFYLSTILDDYSRYIIAWKLCTTMKAADVTDTLELALEASGCNNATVIQKPRLLSDNGSSYVAADLADYLDDKGMDHVRGAPHHPQTQGKIERYHRSMKNVVKLDNYYFPGELEAALARRAAHDGAAQHLTDGVGLGGVVDAGGGEALAVEHAAHVVEEGDEDAKVGDLGGESDVQQHVVWLKVAVDDRRILAV